MRLNPKAALLFMALTLAVAACKKNDPPNTNQEHKNENAMQTKANPVPTETELEIAKIFLADEIRTYLLNGKSIIKEQGIKINDLPTKLTANQIQLDYEKNEVSADLKYKEKPLYITGTISGINRSIGDNYFIGLKGGSNPYMTPKAKMADGYIDYLSKLNKGEKIELFCEGDGMLIGSAMLKECTPFNEYAIRKSEEIIQSNNPSRIKDEILGITYIITGYSKNPTACLSAIQSKKCSNEFEKSIKNLIATLKVKETDRSIFSEDNQKIIIEKVGQERAEKIIQALQPSQPIRILKFENQAQP